MSSDPDFPGEFGSVAILGVGLIGGSLGMALKSRGLARSVLGVGRNAERLETALGLGAIDSYSTDFPECLASCDLVFLCTTVGHILETLPAALGAAKRSAIVTDVGSTKSAIAARAGADPRFIGSHPMAGSERAGVEAANPLLFDDATWVLTPAETTAPRSTEMIRALAQAIGARTLVTSPETHDEMVAVTSHLPHVLAAALMRLADSTRAERPDLKRVAAGSFGDMTRIAASSPEIWRDVCLTNRDAVLDSLAKYRGEMDRLQNAVERSDVKAIEEFFRGSARAKRDWQSG